MKQATVNVGACSEDGCDEPAIKRGLCNRHYQRHRLHRARSGNEPLCTLPGCRRLRHARGLCNRHYLRWKAHGDPLIVRTTARRRRARRIEATVVHSVRLPRPLYGRLQYEAAIRGVKVAVVVREALEAALSASDRLTG